MIPIIILFLFSSPVYADVFTKPTSADQTKLENTLVKDNQGFYHRTGMDYNIASNSYSSVDLNKGSISLGCDRFDSEKSIKNYVINQIDSNSISNLQDQFVGNQFLLLQYSSPSIADLLKHFDTMAHMQVSMRQGQCSQMEQSLSDPITNLHKQALLDCLKDIGEDEDINAAFEACIDLNKPFNRLNTPKDGRMELQSEVDITSESLERVKGDADLTDIQRIIPLIKMGTRSLHIEAPNQRIQGILLENRISFLKTLEDAIKSYKQNRQIRTEHLQGLSVAGFPITESQIKDLAALNETSSYLASHKMSSQLAYLKTMDLYTKALEYLKRALTHPAIQPGYKRLLQENYSFITSEMDTLKGDKERLNDYFQFMSTILDETDTQKLKTLAHIKQKSIQEERKGIFNLNP